jgi:hypothetical protein
MALSPLVIMLGIAAILLTLARANLRDYADFVSTR